MRSSWQSAGLMLLFADVAFVNGSVLMRGLSAGIAKLQRLAPLLAVLQQDLSQ